MENKTDMTQPPQPQDDDDTPAADDNRHNLYAVTLSDTGGNKAGMAWQVGAIIGLVELGLLRQTGAFSATGTGCLVLALLMETIGDSRDNWDEFVRPSQSLTLLTTPHHSLHRQQQQ